MKVTRSLLEEMTPLEALEDYLTVRRERLLNNLRVDHMRNRILGAIYNECYLLELELTMLAIQEFKRNGGGYRAKPVQDGKEQVR